MKLSFEVLEALDAIDSTGTFTEAAELLHRVPSSLTYLVQKVESELAVELFDRTGRRVKLTHTGRVVVEEGRRLLFAAKQLERKAKRVQDGWESELRICLDEILPFDAMWPYVHRFYEQDLGTHLRLSREVHGGTWDALVHRRADLIIGAAGELPQIAHLVTRPIGSLRHVFAVAPHHPLAALDEPIPMNVVAQHRAAVINDTSRELEPRRVASSPDQTCISVPTLEAQIQAQCEGIAVGVLPQCLAARPIAEGRLVAKRITGLHEFTHCCLAWRDDESGRALEWWVEQLDHADLIDRFLEHI